MNARLPLLPPPKPAAFPTLSWDAGQTIYPTNSLANCFYVVRSGVVRLEMFSLEGQRCIVQLLGAGSAFGLEALHQPVRQADALACTPVDIQRIVVQRHHGQASVPEAFKDELIALLLRHGREAMAWRMQFTQGLARRRLMGLLLRLDELCADQPTVWLPTGQEIGDTLGITHVTASRIVAQLCRDRLMRRTGSRTAWLDAAGLRRAMSLTA